MARKLIIKKIFSILSALVIFMIMPLYAQELPTNIDNRLTTQQLENLKARVDQQSGPEGNNLPTGGI